MDRMSWVSSEAVGVLVFLLPGFVAAAVFYSLTSHPKPGAFDRIVQALIFTVIGQAIATIIFLSIGGINENSEWSKFWEYVPSFIVSITIAVLAAYVLNNDVVHRILRRIGITRETSYPSEWYSTFARHECYVVLHMKGQRRLFGWPEEWPSHPDEGHFRIAEGEWWEDDKWIPAEGVAILIPTSEVEMVEFMEYPEQPERT